MSATLTIGTILGGVVLKAGGAAGTILTLARPVFGGTQHLVQDYGLTIGGAAVAELIACGVLYASAKHMQKKDPSAGAVFPFIAIPVAFSAAAVGAVAGLAASVAISYFY